MEHDVTTVNRHMPELFGTCLIEKLGEPTCSSTELPEEISEGKPKN